MNCSRTLLLSVCLTPALLLGSCDDSSVRNAEEKAFDALGVKPLPPPAEIERQRKMIESVNRCLGLLEAAKGRNDDNIVAALKGSGIAEITSNELQPLLSKAEAIEKESSLPDAEIVALATRSRSLFGVSLETKKGVKELTDCVELSKIEARNSAQ